MKNYKITVIILGIILLFPSICIPLSPEYKVSIIKECNYLLWKHPHIVYKWDTQGGIHLYDQGWSDCSGTIYQVFRKVGVPVQRVTAFDMEASKGGWKGKPSTLDKADEVYIIWWTWRNPETGKMSPRKHGHVGLFLVSTKSGLLEVMHNSTSRGLHIEPLKGQLRTDISSIKELTIGDPSEVKLGKSVIKLK